MHSVQFQCVTRVPRCALPSSLEQVEALRWISGQPPAEYAREGSMRFQVKTRHGPQMRDCLLRVALRENGQRPDRPTTGYVDLDTLESAIAPGQFAAFYVRDECVGSGVIAK